MQSIVHIATSLVVLVGIVLYAISLHLKRENKYIREAYAFFVLMRSGAFICAGFLLLIPRHGYLALILYALQKAAPWIVKYESAAYLLLSAAFLVGFIIAFVKGAENHARWNGTKSVRQVQLDSHPNLNPNLPVKSVRLIKEACYFIYRQKHGHMLRVFKAEEPETEETVFDFASALPWYQEFAEIYSIYDKRLRLSPEEHWHPEETCYVRKSEETQYFVALVCDEFPDDVKKKLFLRFLTRLGYNYSSIVFAVKNNTDSRDNYTIQMDDFDISVKFKNNLLSQMVDFGPYFASIKEKMAAYLDVDSTLSLSDIYTSLLCKLESSEEIHNVDDYIDSWLAESGHRQLALVGEYGQGKTATALHLTMRLIASGSSRIPIFLSLRGKAPRNTQGFEVFASFSANYGIDLNALKILNANGRLLLIFDAFDEMDYVGGWGVRRLHFKNLWKLVTPDTKMILTGRPSYFAGIEEFNSALLNKITARNIPYGSVVVLQKFTLEQISDVLSKADTKIKSEIESVLAKTKSKQFFDLISRPSHLSLIIRIWESRNLIEKTKNLTAASVIDEFLQNSYERQLEKNAQATYNVLSPLEREYFMLGIALQMHDIQMQEIDRYLLENIIDGLVDRFPNDISKTTPVICNFRGGKSLKDYYYENPNNRSSIITDIRTCGVLATDESQSKWFFGHRSFHELLVAKCFYGKYKSNDDEYHIMTDSLFDRQNITLRALRSTDFVQKKLLAELVSSIYEVSALSASTNPQFMFRRYYRLIVSPFWGRANPSSAFKKYCKLSRVESEAGSSTVKRTEVYRLRLLPIIALPVTIVLFVARWLYLSATMEADAFLNYINTLADFVQQGTYENTYYLSNGKVWLALTILLIIMIIVLGGYFLSKHMSRNYVRNADVTFFVWYYSLRENGVSNEALLECFEENQHDAFTEFIAGLELNY